MVQRHRQLQQPERLPHHGDGAGLQEAYAILQERAGHRVDER